MRTLIVSLLLVLSTPFAEAQYITPSVPVVPVPAAPLRVFVVDPLNPGQLIEVPATVVPTRRGKKIIFYRNGRRYVRYVRNPARRAVPRRPTATYRYFRGY